MTTEERVWRDIFLMLHNDPALAEALRKPMHWPHTQDAYRTLVRMIIESYEAKVAA